MVIAAHGCTVELPEEVRHDPRVIVVNSDGPGVSAVRNAAAGAATGEALLFLDDDDEMALGALQTLRRLLTFPGTGVACGVAEIVDASGARRGTLEPRDLGPLYHGLDAIFLAGTFLVPRCIFEAVGRFDEDLAFGENYDLGIRLSMALHRRGLRAGSTRTVVVRCAPSGNRYRDERGHAAQHALSKYRDHLADLGRERATLEAILGVYRWRVGARRVGRRHLLRAVLAWPRDPRHWARALLAFVPPLADRRWTR